MTRPSMADGGRAAADALNRGCACHNVDRARLLHALAAEEGVAEAWLAERPNLFSGRALYVAQAHLDAMAGLAAAMHRVVRLPGWQARVLARVPASARHAPLAAGVFLGYDFHLGPDGPRLIEINTNAGGGLLCAKLLHAQASCCGVAEGVGAIPAPGAVEAAFLAMFREEWRRSRGERPLQRVAIVDEAPAGQFLWPEFRLFAELFAQAGIEALIVDPDELAFDGERLAVRGQSVDLVYNRLTDFGLDAPASAALRAAYLADAVVVTPHPRAHALYADKRNLVLLGDDAWLAEIGVSEDDRARIAACVPRTIEVTPDTAETFWAERRHWFFKPSAGYGSKAAYRGDKLTKGVFAAIAQGGYVAQALVPPSERWLPVDGVERALKVDVRNYAYDGAVQLVSARLYQGQTTNFRTPGGGFAAVFPVA